MTHRSTMIAALALALGLATSSAMADQPVVVELITSQGCSSCPPADALQGELAGREDVIALALHVDYWDYIGWADTFAQAAFTERQHGYGRAAHSTVVYTPQMVVGGVDHVVGNRPMEVGDLIATHRATPYPVDIASTPSSGGWRVSAVWIGPGAAPDMVVQIVTYSPMEEVAITRGENSGLTTAYYNIVRSWQVMSDWSGAEVFEAQVTAGGNLPHVVIIQTSGNGAILGAARLE